MASSKLPGSLCRACLCWEGNARCQVPQQLCGEWSWRCRPAAPHSFLPPLPASVLAAPGTRNPSDVTCPARPSGTHWRHKQCPAQPAWHLGARGTVPAIPAAEQRQATRLRHFRDWVPHRDKEASIPWDSKVFHALTYSLVKVGQLVNSPEFTGFRSLDRDCHQRPHRNPSLPPLFS